MDKLILAILEAERIAIEMGRLKTMKALNDAAKVAGWELANDIVSKGAK